MPVTDLDQIIRVAPRGDGITNGGRHVPLTAPGDRVAADGSIRRGPHHVEPPCRHFPECGGCQLQHLDDPSWSGFIVDRIAAALAAHGLQTEIRGPRLSPPRTRRRAALHAERRGRQVHLGFTEQSSHRLIDVIECHVLAPELFALLNPLRGMLAAMLPDRGRSDVRLTLTDQGVDILVERVRAEDLAAIEALTAFAHRHGLARLAIDDGYGAEPRWEPDPVTITLGGVAVPFPHGAFLQATREGELALVEAAREAVGAAGAVADLFAGLGTFTFAFPDARVYAAEGARDALLSLKAAAGHAGRAVFADHRDLFRRPLVPGDLNHFDAVLLDPPRAGAKEQIGEIAQSSVARVAYISCNPSTFARDAETLSKGGYRLDWIQPVGQFRWSTHVELAAQFTRG